MLDYPGLSLSCLTSENFILVSCFVVASILTQISASVLSNLVAYKTENVWHEIRGQTLIGENYDDDNGFRTTRNESDDG